MSKFMRSRHVPLVKEEPKVLDEELDLFLDDVEEAGHVLRTLREARGWSLSDLANQVDLDAALISAMESGSKPISERLAKHFSEIFHTHMREFL